MRLPWQKKEIERGGYTAPLSWSAYQGMFSYNNNLYPFGLNQTMRGERQEEIGNDFASLVNYAYKSNGVVFACMVARQLLFSEATFQFRQRRNGRPGPLFGTPGLGVLEKPGGPGSSQTTGDLLNRAIQDADLAGNWFAHRDGNRINRLRPDWVSIVLGSDRDAEDASVMDDAEVLGFVYHPGGYSAEYDPVAFLVDEVAHFAPIPDPIARFRGMSWLTPVIREIMADQSATSHKSDFFGQGATPNMIVKVPESVRQEALDNFVDKFRANYEGAANAYKTMFLGSGTDATVVGANMQQMDFKQVQGAGETRIAAAARIHPVIVGLSEGLQGSSLNAGNFGAARRLVADATMRPLWRNMAGSLANIVVVPGGAELWYDDRDISFLQEDLKDQADVQQLQAIAIKTLVDAGYDTASVVDAITSNDFARLQHTGLVSVQLQPPGAQTSASNGSNGASKIALPSSLAP